MPFEAYLSETHARPMRARLVGYAASVVMHAPPVAAFTFAWLTHALVIGGSREPLELRDATIPYRIPVALWAAARGVGGNPGAVAAPAPGEAAAPRAGGAGVVPGTRPRALLAPAEVEPFPLEPMRESEYAYEGYVPSSEEPAEEAGGALDGLGYAIAGIGEGELGIGLGDGEGTRGEGAGGPGGDGAAPGGILLAADEPKARPRSRRREDPKSEGPGLGAEGAGEGDGAEERGDAPAAPPAEEATVPLPSRPAVRASYISEKMASYFRTSETFPGLPAEYYHVPGRKYRILLQVCVSTEGTVSDVQVKESIDADADRIVTAAVHGWRYRPRVVAGVPRPFCHPIRIEYSSAQRVFR